MIIEVCQKKEADAAKDEWRRTEWLAVQLMNVSGNLRRTVRPGQLIKFADEKRKLSPKDREIREQQLKETAMRHKAKFWTKIKGQALEDAAIMRGGADEDVLPRGPSTTGL